MSLSPGPSTFTEDQLRVAWQNGLQKGTTVFESADPRHQGVSAYCEVFRRNQDGSMIEPEARQRRLTDFGERLMTLAAEPTHHFRSIDQEFSELFVVQYNATSFEPKITEDVAVQRAHGVLVRVPVVAPKIDLSYAVYSGHSGIRGLGNYFNSGVSDLVSPNRQHELRASPWNELQVVTNVSATTLEVALLIDTSEAGRYDVGVCLHNLLDMISELMDAIEASLKSDMGQFRLLPGNIVKAYLWTTWQRCLILFFWFILRHELRFGFDEEWNHLLALRGMSLLMHPSIRATLYGWANERHQYMCTWAFELLKTHRATLGLDLRHFHQKFAELHAGKAPRCLWDSQDACDGDHPLSCGRFIDKRLVAKEQSFHDLCPGGCDKLLWDITSYMSISGPVAVSFETKDKRIKYTQASDLTMAISHVWSHGFGGRPDTGMNSCLHKRFVRIARQHGCTSYWMDTLCIPAEHKLRAEAIGFINRIFTDSKTTLVVDKDLMDIDVTNINTGLLESLLATFLVCDWNVRAWTMLEAVKGSHGVHLLCKDNRTICLRDALTQVHQNERIDLSILFLATQHLLPASTDAFRRKSSRTTIEVAGSFLSHRHATREGDDIVIWSLLSNIKVYYNAKEMWKGLVKRRVRTAYLMSNTPRLENVPGFSWAPSSPYIRRKGGGLQNDFLGPYLTFDGAESEHALITADGLSGDWRVFYVDEKDSSRYQDHAVTMTSFSADGVRKEEVLPVGRVINRCWEAAVEHLKTSESVILIQPTIIQSRQYDGQYRRAGSKGESHGEVFAICVSCRSDKWIWKGVMAWPRAVPLPPMWERLGRTHFQHPLRPTPTPSYWLDRGQIIPAPYCKSPL